MKEAQPSGEELFSLRFRQLERVIQNVATHRCLNTEEGQELYSLVMFKVVQDDYALLRRFRGTSRWKTYFTVVVQRVLLDFRVKEWGRWRPCTKAQQLGPTAILLDRCINRDGLEPAEAICTLSTRGLAEAGDLERLVDQIPRRPRGRRLCSSTHLGDLIDPATDQSFEVSERQRIATRLKQVIASTLQELSEFERDLIGLRFGRGWTIRRIAASRDLPARPLYRTFERILRRLRDRLERGGLVWSDFAAIFDGQDTDVELDLF